MAFTEVVNTIDEIGQTLNALGHTSTEDLPQWRTFLSVCMMGKLVFEGNNQVMNERVELLVSRALTYLPEAQQEIEEVCPDISERLFADLNSALHNLIPSSQAFVP